jgi:hypothetical protein
MGAMNKKKKTAISLTFYDPIFTKDIFETAG